MEARVARLEEDMREVKSLLNDKIVPMLIRIDERLNHTATKAELAEKPSKSYLWMVLGVMVAAIFGAVALGVTIAPAILQR